MSPATVPQKSTVWTLDLLLHQVRNVLTHGVPQRIVGRWKGCRVQGLYVSLSRLMIGQAGKPDVHRGGMNFCESSYLGRLTGVFSSTQFSS
jgi:hypothetical protein